MFGGVTDGEDAIAGNAVLSEEARLPEGAELPRMDAQLGTPLEIWVLDESVGLSGVQAVLERQEPERVGRRHLPDLVDG